MNHYEITERDVKSQTKSYLDLKGIDHFHILQGLGCYPGIPDRIMLYQGKTWMLEIKKPKGKLSPKQIDFQAMCERNGVPYVVVRSIEDLMEVIDG